MAEVAAAPLFAILALASLERLKAKPAATTDVPPRLAEESASKQLEEVDTTDHAQGKPQEKIDAENKKSFLDQVIAALGTRDGSLSNLVKTARANPDLVNGVFISNFADAVREAAENDRLSSNTQWFKELNPLLDIHKTRKAATKASQAKTALAAFDKGGGKRTRRRLRGGVVMTTEVSALINLALYGNPNQKAVSEAFASIVTATPPAAMTGGDPEAVAAEELARIRANFPDRRVTSTPPPPAAEEVDQELARISRPAEILRGPFTEFINFRARFLESNDERKRNCAITMFKVVLDRNTPNLWRPVLFIDRAANINAWGAVALEAHPELKENLTTAAQRVLGVKAIPGKVAAAASAAASLSKSGAVGALGLVVSGAKAAPGAARAGISAVSGAAMTAASAAYELAQRSYDAGEKALNSLVPPKRRTTDSGTGELPVSDKLVGESNGLDSVSTAASAAQAAQADSAFDAQGEAAPTHQLNGIESDTGDISTRPVSDLATNIKTLRTPPLPSASAQLTGPQPDASPDQVNVELAETPEDRGAFDHRGAPMPTARLPADAAEPAAPVAAQLESEITQNDFNKLPTNLQGLYQDDGQLHLNGSFGALRRYVLKTPADQQSSEELVERLAGQCGIPGQQPTNETLTTISGDGWCFYKAILAALHNDQSQIFTAATDRDKSNKAPDEFARGIAKLLRENKPELDIYKERYGKSRRTNVIQDNGGAKENIELTPEQYLDELEKPPVIVNGLSIPRVFAEGDAIARAAALYYQTKGVLFKIAIYGPNGDLRGTGCPDDKKTSRIISLKHVGGNHFDVFLPTTPPNWEQFAGRRKSPRRRRHKKLRKSTFRRHRKH